MMPPLCPVCSLAPVQRAGLPGARSKARGVGGRGAAHVSKGTHLGALGDIPPHDNAVGIARDKGPAEPAPCERCYSSSTAPARPPPSPSNPRLQACGVKNRGAHAARAHCAKGAGDGTGERGEGTHCLSSLYNKEQAAPRVSMS